MDVIYTDFAKAFDRIDHCVLLNKLGSFGFSISSQIFLNSYLKKRKQYVSYNCYNSTTYIATYGVPQGSNLGPLLFLLFINDLSEILMCHKLFFADDLKLFTDINGADNCDALQSELDQLNIWCTDNKLHLNTSKCKIVSFSRKQSIYRYRVYNW